MRSLIRKKNDTSAIWGDLARVDNVDTNSYLRRGLSRFIFVFAVLAVVISLVTSGIYISNLRNAQPNVGEVMSKAKHSLVAVHCKDWQGSGVAMEIPVPKSYKTAILSAAHVFEECAEGDKVIVEHEGVTYTAMLAKKDPATGNVPHDSSTHDIALIYLKADLPKLQPAPEAQIGDWTMVLGNPLNYSDYLTLGIVTNSNQDNYMTDAASNPGNSGGPVLDSHGRVLGILVSGRIIPDAIEENQDGIYLNAEGMSRLVRLRTSCTHLFSSQANCPFSN